MIFSKNNHNTYSDHFIIQFAGHISVLGLQQITNNLATLLLKQFYKGHRI